MRLAAATPFSSVNMEKVKARTRVKAKARTPTKANEGLNAAGTILHFPHLRRPLLRPHRPNTLDSPRTPARSSHPNTSPPDPTVTAGSTDGFFPIPATSVNESSNLTTRHASTQHLRQALPRQETRTSNPRTNHGGFEGTRKTTHNVFHPRFHINNLRCHNRGCYSQTNLNLPQPTTPLLPGLPGSTNNPTLRRHNRGCKLNYYQMTRLAHNLRPLPSLLSLNYNLRLYHHPLGPRSTSPLCVAQQSQQRVQPSTTPPRQTARPHSLPESPHLRLNYKAPGPTTPLIDNTRMRRFRRSHPTT